MVRDVLKMVSKSKLHPFRPLEADGPSEGRMSRKFSWKVKIQKEDNKVREKNRIWDHFCCGPSFQIGLLFITSCEEKYVEGCQE